MLIRGSDPHIGPLRVGSNGHCGTQGTAERVRRIYALPADMPTMAKTEPFPEKPRVVRTPPEGLGARFFKAVLEQPGALRASSSAPNLTFQKFDTSRTRLNQQLGSKSCC